MGKSKLTNKSLQKNKKDTIIASESEEDVQTSENEKDEDEKEHFDLDASSTESDEDTETEGSDEDNADQDDNDKNPEEDDDAAEPLSKADIVKAKILSKYQGRKGKQLYVRFPHKLPLDESEFQQKAKSLSPLIIKAHKPRQKHARFCLVDFETEDDRNKTLKTIKKLSETDANFKGILVCLPKTESDEFVNELIERKQKSIENKRAKAMMKRATKQAQLAKKFTTSVVVTNLPTTSSMAQLRNLFSNAVDIQIKPFKGKRNDTSFATITLPTTKDARLAVKQKLSIDGTELIVKFNTQQKRKKADNKSKQNLKRKAQDDFQKDDTHKVKAKKAHKKTEAAAIK